MSDTISFIDKANLHVLDNVDIIDAQRGTGKTTYLVEQFISNYLSIMFGKARGDEFLSKKELPWFISANTKMRDYAIDRMRSKVYEMYSDQELAKYLSNTISKNMIGASQIHNMDGIFMWGEWNTKYFIDEASYILEHSATGNFPSLFDLINMNPSKFILTITTSHAPTVKEEK